MQPVIRALTHEHYTIHCLVRGSVFLVLGDIHIQYVPFSTRKKIVSPKKLVYLDVSDSVTRLVFSFCILYHFLLQFQQHPFKYAYFSNYPKLYL